MNEVKEFLGTQIGQGFMLGLLSSGVILVLNFLRELILGALKAKREDRLNRKAAQDAQRANFEELLVELLPEVDVWMQWEERNIRFLYPASDADESINVTGYEQHWENFYEIAHILARMFVKSPDAETRALAVKARKAALALRDEYDTQDELFEADRRTARQVQAALKAKLQAFKDAVWAVYTAHLRDELPVIAHTYFPIPEIKTAQAQAGRPAETHPPSEQ